MSTDNEVSALDAAKIRFIGALPQKAEELKRQISTLTHDPTSTESLSVVRRQLHALYASAQVFQLDHLVQSLKKSISALDEVSLHGHSLDEAAIEILDELLGSLDQFPTMFPSQGSENFLYPPVGSLRHPSTGIEHSTGVEHSFVETKNQSPESQVQKTEDPPNVLSLEETSEEDASDLQKLLWPLEAANRVLHVLVVNDVEAFESMKAMLPTDRVQFQLVRGAENALRKSRSGAMDVVLVSQRFLQERDPGWIDRLQGDNWTNPVSVVLLLDQNESLDSTLKQNPHVSGFVQSPFDLESLVDTLTYAIGTIARSTPPPEPAIGEVTVSDVAERLSNEIREGLTADAEQGSGEKIALGDGEEILHATWNAIQQVRQVISDKSEGKVQFKPTEKHGSSIFPAPNDSLSSQELSSPVISLQNRNIFIVDDDASVVWMLAGLLRSEGAEVREFNDGRQAMQAAQLLVSSHEIPDLILCDIVMPEFDGFALCRALQKDPVLREIPVIFLSWKEDYLRRMRDLQSGAKGYVRKEAGNDEILSEIKKVLRPISRLEAQLKTEIEVRGQIEDIGIVSVLRTIVKQRPDAHVSIRDAWNLFELVFKEGTLADLNRTSSDGNFAQGTDVFKELIGVTSGKFTVIKEKPNDSRVWMDEPLEGLLSQAIDHLRKVLSAVSGAQMSQVAKVEISPDVIQALLQTSPGEVRAVIQKLTSGKGPRELLLGGEVEPQLLETVLTDLARQGALHSVIGPNGEDRLASALSSGRSSIIPENNDTSQVDRLKEAQLEETELEKVATAEIEEIFDVEELDEQVTSSHEIEMDEIEVEDPQKPRKRSSRPSNPSSGNTASFPVPDFAAYSSQYPSNSNPSLSVHDEVTTVGAAPIRSEVSSKTIEDKIPLEEAQRIFEAQKNQRNISPVQQEDTSFIKYAIFMVSFLVMGFVGWKLYLDHQSENQITELPQNVFNPPIQLIEQEGNETVAKEAVDKQTAESSKLAGDPAQPNDLPTLISPPENPLRKAALPHEHSFGKVIDGIQNAKVKVDEGEGLVTLQMKNLDPNAKVFLGDKALDKPPFQIALPEGSYEISLRKPQSTQYRYLFVPAGKTRVVSSF